MLENNKCILVYGLTNIDLEFIKKLNYKIIEITPEMCEMTLGDILLGLKLQAILLGISKYFGLNFSGSGGFALSPYSSNFFNCSSSFLFLSSSCICINTCDSDDNIVISIRTISDETFRSI